MKNKIFSSGFTLIEILIVVALLGALAIGLMATLDPFQQLRKGTDSTRRSLANDLYRSFISYQATKGAFPWSVDLATTTGDDASMTTADTGYIDMLVDNGELKNNFIASAGTHLGKLNITSTADANSVFDLNVCYLPESKSFMNDPGAIYNIDGTDGTTCVANGGGTDTCYICIK